MKSVRMKWSTCGLALAMGGLVAPAASSIPSIDIRHDATVEAVQRVMPAVVNIRTETIVERHDPFEQLIREFWGRQQRGPETSYSLGSGVIIDEDGWVLTN